MDLAKENDRILVISKYALDCKPYNTSDVDVTWETCSLRQWLNSSFINNAFTVEEKAMIPSETIANPEYSTIPGRTT